MYTCEKKALTFSACPVTLAFIALSVADLKSLLSENYARQNTFKVIRLSHYKLHNNISITTGVKKIHVRVSPFAFTAALKLAWTPPHTEENYMSSFFIKSSDLDMITWLYENYSYLRHDHMTMKTTHISLTSVCVHANLSAAVKHDITLLHVK